MKKVFLITLFILVLVALVIFFVPNTVFTDSLVSTLSSTASTSVSILPQAVTPTLDKALYDQEMLALANHPIIHTKPNATSTASAAPSINYLWPVKTVYPNYGALLPFNRIVAYYGNFYSKQMGVLGEYPPQQMLTMLMSEVSKWQAADPTTPVIPAIDYIAVSAQGSPGADGMYRARMPADQIQKAIDLANQVHGIVFLDIQVGKSTVETEVPLLADYLKIPNVELALDPEFSMSTSGKKPGTVIGTMDARDINFAANFLANIVKQNNLAPKILVVHRFTNAMVTNYQNITPLPEVQVVMDMDGYGGQPNKIKAYHDVIYEDPVQFTGLKLFYKNDIAPPSTGMLSTSQVLDLQPKPIYIQYQ